MTWVTWVGSVEGEAIVVVISDTVDDTADVCMVAESTENKKENIKLFFSLIKIIQ